jgi:hypothetical protein
MFVKEYPQTYRDVNATVKSFIERPEMRVKQRTPDLGQFIALLTVSTLGWKDVRRAYMTESLDRNVLWVAKKFPDLGDETSSARKCSFIRSWKTDVSSQRSIEYDRKSGSKRRMFR